MSATADDIEDLVGGTAKPRRPYRRTRPKDDIDAKLEEQVARGRNVNDPGATKDLGLVHSGVTMSWLSQAFGIDPKYVKYRLRHCVPIRITGKERIYSLPDAAQYLVKPKINIEDYLKSIKIQDLPQRLQDTYWSAMRKKQVWEEHAGHLWRTESVIEVFGDTFQAIKSGIQLWVDEIERETEITPAQRAILIEQCDILQQRIYDKLLAIPKKRATLSTAHELDGKPVEKKPEDDFSDLI